MAAACPYSRTCARGSFRRRWAQEPMCSGTASAEEKLEQRQHVDADVAVDVEAETGFASTGFHRGITSESLYEHKGVREMNRFRKMLRKLIVNEQGAALVEYGLLVALIALVALGAIEAVGGGITALFNQVAGELPAAP